MLLKIFLGNLALPRNLVQTSYFRSILNLTVKLEIGPV